ncbi:unnamed protein product [Citrullus colocynthis]|uniref:TF-B3 domain-containing protein n=1 Tax=Citrullus colocynthis TaxID=252529 RepID=A0ABP0YIM6_9ROSI
MASSPKFFRIVLQRNLQDAKLMIPKTFVKDYGKLFSSSVSLKLSDGKEWKVGLTTAGNGAVWLEKGWNKFSEYYCLEFGSLLVFRLLDGRSSSFDVTIFDPTGVETQYSCNLDFSTAELEEDTDSDSDSDKILESFDVHLKKRKKASVPCRQSRKKMRKEDSFTIKTEPEEEEGCNNIFRNIPSCKERMSKDEVKFSRKKQQLANKVEATQRFSSKSDQKPYFKVVMRQSNVRGRFNLVIPYEFAGKYLPEEFGTINLRIVNGKNWQLLYKWCRTIRANYAYISSGWKRFAEENHLKEGDIGFFQLIKNHNFMFTKLQDTPSSSLSSKKGTATTTNNHFFEMDRSYKSSYLRFKLGNKQWNMTLKQYDGYVRFSAGWSTSRDDNGLEDGDTCLFEMFELDVFSSFGTLHRNLLMMVESVWL